MNSASRPRTVPPAPPLITVLTLSYNSPDLYASIDSVLEQNYGPIQYIVIDDGSKTFEVEKVKGYIRAHAGKNIVEWTVEKNSVNQGTVRTLNHALRQAKGEYIFNLAGDDLFADSKVLLDWVAAFERTGAEIMTARRLVYDQELRRCIGVKPTDREARLIKKLVPQELFERMGAANWIFGCCTARSKESFEKYGYYDEHYRLIEDHPKTLSLLRNGVKIEFFDRVVLKYRGGGTSSAAQYNRVYEQDAEQIFLCELLPYTRYPEKQKKRYHQWKKDQELGRRYQAQCQKYRGKKVPLFLLWVWYRAHHPWRNLMKAPGKLKELIDAGGMMHDSQKNHFS